MLYDKIKKLRKQGKTPVIELAPGTLIRKDKLPPHRPRKYPPDMEMAARYVGRRGKTRPRCIAKGCIKMLRVNQVLVCSPICADRIVNDAIIHLKSLGISKDELLKLYGE